ncbi:hypothetical protein OKW46_001114 [Paraburkholderia sp. WSM4179]|nr:hypothetical protein [Paraburkholderia sp. WSM4179]
MDVLQHLSRQLSCSADGRQMGEFEVTKPELVRSVACR